MRLELDDPRWAVFVGQRPEALPYHDPAWASLLARCYGCRAFVHAEVERGEVRAGVPVLEVDLPLRPRAWVSLPFTDYCPPLAVDPTSGRALIASLEAARRAQHVAALEVRAELDAPGLTLVPRGVRHELALDSDPRTVYRGFHRSQVQGNIRRSEREGVSVRRAEAPEDLCKAFYGLHLRTRRRHGVPIQPRRFFRMLWEEIVRPGLGFVLLAEAAGVEVAGAVFLTSAHTVTCKYAASEQDSWGLRPNHAIFWSAIRWACKEGYARFDFGRTEPENQGLRNFKNTWGAEESELAYSVSGKRSVHKASERSATVLAAIITRSPPWVCRTAGELAYRYVA